MAECAVQFVIEKLNDFLTKEAYFLVGVDEKVRSLRTKLEWIRAFLKDADCMPKDNERIKLWVSQIREVAYDAEDVIDAFIFNDKQKREGRNPGWMGYLTSFARSFKDIPSIHDLGKKISDIERRLDEISSNRSQYGIDNLPSCGEASSSSNQIQVWRKKRAPIVEEVDVVGFEDKTKTLVGQLTEGDPRRAVISITGMGGVGKTTLAKKVYSNIHVKKRFSSRAWVYVSQEYRVREILLSIIKCFKTLEVGEIERPSEEDLRQRLSKYLKRKKYLVVLDDIWSKDAWEGLVSAFPDEKRGSRVLLTTRNEDIARYADPQSTPYKVDFLDENGSWKLFCKKALLANPPPECPPNLEKLGREMVAKCGGLPLAITVLGGVLSRKEQSVIEWDKVFRNVQWWINESEDGITGILALSYHDLPYYLKSCFLYFGAFPEDSEIPVAQLIKLWIAEGFVQQRGEEEMEDVADDYINELISRSMIQVAKRKSNGMAKKCHIHDLLRDLSISKAKEERFLAVYGNVAPRSPTKGRRLAITCCFSKSIFVNRSTLHLRSLLCFSKETEIIEKSELKMLFGAFKLLRVMDLGDVGLSSLPNEIWYLIHLRYLHLMGMELKCLPSTITRLSNLQTLNLQRTCIFILPEEIWKMDQIRHLLLMDGCQISNNTPLHHLSNLQTLTLAESGSWIEEGLEKLTNLRELGITGDLEMTLSHSVCKLVRLRSLFLEASHECTIPSLESFSDHQHLYKMELRGRLEKLLDLHEFPPNLSELDLSGSKLEQDQMGTLEKLPNLRNLRLHWNAYLGKEMVFYSGGFPLLDDFVINQLSELEEWKVEDGAMPNLRCLQISYCKNLKMLPDGLQHVTTLQELKLVTMPEFKERVTREGEDWFKIRHIPSIIIKD